MLLYFKNPIRLTFIISLLVLSFSLKAQIPSVQEIFDFEIGNEFHSQNQNNNGPPNASRYKIIGKWYSQNTDTLYYRIQHNDYTSTFNPSPNPHLDYVFYNYIDTVAYTNLDSSIVNYLNNRSDLTNYTLVNYSYDTANQYCQNQLHKFTFSTGGAEPDITELHYSKGLGSLYHFHSSPSAVPSIYFESNTIYYKKDNKICGTKDTVGLSIETIDSKQTITIFPNPSTNKAYLHMPDNQAYHLEVYDMNSRAVFQEDINSKTYILDVSNYSKGIYLLKIHNTNNSYSTKLIIE